MSVQVKSHTRAGHKVRAYTRGAKSVTVVGRQGKKHVLSGTTTVRGGRKYNIGTGKISKKKKTGTKYFTHKELYSNTIR